MNLNYQIDKLCLEVYDVITEVQDLVASQTTEHPGVTRLSEQAFTLSFSKLDSGILSPEYYDWPGQIKKIIALMEDAKGLRALHVLLKILEEGKYRKGQNTIKFHPDLIELLKEKILT